MIKRLSYGRGFPLWLGELPGENIDLCGQYGARLAYNLDTRRLWFPVDEEFIAPIEDTRLSNYSRSYLCRRKGAWEALPYYGEGHRSKDVDNVLVFMPACWCAFSADAVPYTLRTAKDLVKYTGFEVDSPVLDLAGINYVVDNNGNAVVISDNGFIPSVSATVAIIQTCSDSLEFDEGIKHVNLCFAGKAPTEVYLPDSCVSCYIPMGVDFRLSIGKTLAESWDYWSAVWGKPYVVPYGFSVTPDKLVTVRK